MQLSDLQSRLLARLGEDPNAALGNQFFTASEATAALNWAQRLMCFLTLCLETTGTLTLTLNTPFYSLLSDFPDLLLPLRIRTAAGAKVYPARLSDLAALDAAWTTTTGTPNRYALLGFDFLAVYPVPSGSINVSITYAQCPTPLSSATDVPQIPTEYHPELIDGAIPLMRVKEGGEELQKTMPYWNKYLDACTKLADYVRARNREQGYDYMPLELQRVDRSKMLIAPPAKGKKPSA